MARESVEAYARHLIDESGHLFVQSIISINTGAMILLFRMDGRQTHMTVPSIEFEQRLGPALKETIRERFDYARTIG